MALFKIFRGTDISKLTNPANEEYIPLKDGYCYFDTTTGLFFIDAEVVKEDGTTEIVRAPINANRAIYDVVGQRINTTYIKDLSISGKTITYTKGDGATGTITTQDNNTTYSAGTGLSLSGTTFNHKNSVTAATAQGDASKTLTFGGTFTIPIITYDAQGHITSKGTTTMTMPANPNVDTKVTQTATTSNASYPLLLAPNGQTATKTTTSYFDSGVTLNPSTNTITANISGNAATATKLDTARTISLTGSITGSGTFDGSGNLSIATTTNHTHNYAGSSSAGGAANSVKSNLTIKLNSGSTEGTNLFTFNGSTAKTINITPASIGASASGHTHLYAGSESVGGPANSVKESLSFAVGGVNKGSYNGSQGHKIEINAVDLNISSALRYIGRTNNKPEGRVITLVSGSQITAEPGNVVIWTQGNIEYLLDDNKTWVQLGEASSFALAPHIHGNISNQGYITDEDGNSLSNRILISDGTGYIEGGIEISNTLTQKFLNENGTWQTVNVDNFYHSTGTWGGTDNLTYTATANGGAPALAFTLPTAAANQKGVVGIGNNITLASGVISITRENVLTALGNEDVPINITGSAGSLKDSKVTLTGDLNGEIVFNGNKEVTANVTVSSGGGQMLRADLQMAEALSVIAIPTAITQLINNAEEEMSLLVYQNGLLLNQTENYIVGVTNTTIELVDYSCEIGDLFTFIAISNTGYTFENIGDLGFLPLTGGTLSGFLTLAGDPTDSLHAVTKQYVDDSLVELQNGLSSLDSYVKKTGDTMTGNLIISKSSNDSGFSANRSDTGVGVSLIVGSEGTNRGVYDNNLSKWILYSDGADARTQLKLYGAVWNDYAEYRSANSTEPGRCIIEVGDDTLALATKRMQPGASIISDTFGFAIGETDGARTPIAVSGRVLAYGYEDREEFRKAIGRPVCSGPDGTVSIMTDEEYQKYGYCAIGIISAVPDYETWGSGNVPVNGRIWIKVI